MISHTTLSPTSKPAAYSYILFKLVELAKHIVSDTAKEKMMQYIEKIKIAFENHEQDISALKAELIQIDTEISNSQQKDTISKIIEIIEKIPSLNPSQQQRFENPFQRRFESEFGINLLLNPTDKMMEAVNRVSQRLIQLIKLNNEYFFFNVLGACTINGACESFGCFPEKPTLGELITVLQENKKDELMKIMMIHFFAWADYKKTDNPIPAWDVPLVGEFETYVKDRVGQLGIHFSNENSIANAYHAYINRPHYYNKELSYLSDVYFRDCPLYQDRGRGYFSQSTRYNRMGLMLLNQEAEAFSQLSSELKILNWLPDVLCQKTDFYSHYVKDLLCNDVVYVAGVSGMASVLLGLMELLGNLPTIKMKQDYLVAIVAYIVSGGFHSIHEVLSPAEYCLKLVPGYSVGIPSWQNNYRTPPPKYHVFFSLFAQDQQFQEIRNKTWKSFIDTFATNIFQKEEDAIRPVMKKTEMPSVSSGVAGALPFFSQNINRQPRRVDLLDQDLIHVTDYVRGDKAPFYDEHTWIIPPYINC